MPMKKKIVKKPLTLITHPRPHLDDICGMWLLERFWPKAKKVAHKFVSSTTRDAGNESKIFIGVGRGQFDEHKGDVGESATTLVFSFLKKECPDIRGVELAALSEIIEWVRAEDTGMCDKESKRERSIPAIFRSHFDLHKKKSEELVQFGFTLLDDIFESTKNVVRLQEDWKDRVEFKSEWGKAVALETTAYGADDFAYRQGFTLLVLLNPKNGFRGYRASAHAKADLTKAYETLSRADPSGLVLASLKKVIVVWQ